MGPLACWHLPGIFMSSVGIMDQPGYWPPAYILTSRVFLVLLMAFLGIKALFWPFRSIKTD
jgi:hypothetical protein